jgi:hypothetical protein
MSISIKQNKHQALRINFFSAVTLFLTLICFPAIYSAQLPLQDGEGEGTLITDRKGFLQFNIADATAHFGYILDNTTNDFSFGVDISGKVTGKKASFINNNSLAPDAGFAFSVGKKFLFSRKFKPQDIIVTSEFLASMQKILREDKTISKTTELPTPKTLRILRAAAHLSADLSDVPTYADYEKSLLKYCAAVGNKDSSCELNEPGKDSGDILKKSVVNFDRLIFRGGYSYKKYDLFDPARPFDDQLYERNFHKPSAQIIYFAQIGGNKLFGIAGGIEKTNNSNQLTEVEIKDTTTILNGGTTREFNDTNTALIGDFKESTRAFINGDFAWFPSKLNSRIGVDFFARSSLTGKKSFRPGVGFFFSEKDAPTHVIGGVNFSVDNKGKFNVALTAGYNF